MGIFGALMPDVIQKEIQNTKLIVPKADRLKTTKDSRHLLQGIVFYIAIFVLVALYQIYGQSIPYIGVLPGYAYDAQCPAYWSQTTERPCLKYIVQGEECFPYGRYPGEM